MIKNIIKDNNYKINICNNCIHIINYKRIVNINNLEINVELYNCFLLIKGSSLLISALDKYELLIKGNIKGIDFINE